MRRSAIFTVAFFSFGTFQANADPPRYELRVIGFEDGGTWAEARSGNQGFALRISQTSDGYRSSIVGEHDIITLELGTAQSAVAQRLNSNFQAFGHRIYSSSSAGIPTRWDSGEPVTLDYRSGSATDGDDFGNGVGWSVIPDSYATARYYPASGEARDLSSLPSRAYGINPSGTLVVGTIGSVATVFDLVFNSTYSIANPFGWSTLNDINDLGIAVGSRASQLGTSQAFLSHELVTWTLPHDPAGHGSFAAAYGIDSLGTTAVGVSSGQFGNVGRVWLSDGTSWTGYDPNSLIVEYPLPEIFRPKITALNGIDDDGNLYGAGIDPVTGQHVAVMLTPHQVGVPDVTSLPLLTSGIVGLLLVAKRKWRGKLAKGGVNVADHD